MRYAQIEIDSQNVDRARSIFERALAVDYSYVPLWIRYAQTEISWRQFSHARAIFERSVTLLPQEQKLWLSFIEMEELLDNLDTCRSLFERWTLLGHSVAWKTWLKFEKNNHGSTQTILERWIREDPSNLEVWSMLAQETKDDGTVYSCAIDLNQLNEADREEAFLRWAEYEFNRGEMDRGRAILKLGGVKKSPRTFMTVNYRDVESWWAEINIRSKDSNVSTLLEIFNHAVMCCAPTERTHKTAQWRKYAVLWLRYALFVEKCGEDAGRIYDYALSYWPHAEFTSVTLWKAYAEYMLRRNDISSARKIYGSALGKTEGNVKIYKSYIALEKTLLSTDTVRRLYLRCAQRFAPIEYLLLLEFAEFESSLKEFNRARAIYQAAILIAKGEKAEPFWLAWAEMEADNGDFDRARAVWNQAVKHRGQKTVDIWSQYAMFEISTGWGVNESEVDKEAVDRARIIFERAFEAFKERKTERLELFELFIQFEETYGTDATLEALRKRAPRPVVKNRANGNEYIEYDFPEAEPSAISKLMANAKKWAETNANA